MRHAPMLRLATRAEHSLQCSGVMLEEADLDARSASLPQQDVLRLEVAVQHSLPPQIS